MFTREDANVLLTGSSGFLGQSILKVIRGKFNEIICLGSDNPYSRVDISAPFEIIDAPCGIKTVIHAAGKAHTIPKTLDEERDFYRVNFEGTKNLCHALEKLEKLPPSFVFISTVAVYGVDQGLCLKENAPLRGYTPYSKSKILAEQWLHEWSAKNNVKLGILRLPLIAGPRPTGNLSAMVNGIRYGKYLSIGRADARKSIVWAEDVANIIPVLTQKGGTYNLTDGVHPTFGELETAIATALNKRRPVKVPYWVAKALAKTGDIIGSRFPINSEKLVKITSSLTFDDQKAREELGWRPTSVLDKISQII